MSTNIPRVRMFAGPNGSGKTTVKSSLNKSVEWFGIDINPDEIEATIRRTGLLPLQAFPLVMTLEEVQRAFAGSAFLQSQNLHTSADSIRLHGDALDFSRIAFNSYHASVLADFLRRKSLDAGLTFTFETVMSAADKVELLAEAQQRGFRTYLYYFATEDPAIHIQRVKNRVADGGHDVPELKIVERYHRSLALLGDALRRSHRAYLFDTSSDLPWYFAEVTNGTKIDMKSDGRFPTWFASCWSQFQALSAQEQ